MLAGIYKIKEILDVHRVIIAIEDNKPDAIEALTRIADDPKMDPNDEVRVLKLHASYPQGAEKVLVQAATGRKVPAGGLPADVGCLVMNIGSVLFLASYMRTGMPLTMAAPCRTRRMSLCPSAQKFARSWNSAAVIRKNRRSSSWAAR